MLRTVNRTNGIAVALAAAAMILPSGTALASESTLPKPKTHQEGLDGKRHGSFPKPPRFPLAGRTEVAPSSTIRSNAQQNPPRKGARRVTPRKPGTGAQASLGGYHGPYASKLNYILYWVDNYERRVLGSYYRAPTLYPDAERYPSFRCGNSYQALRRNAMYCPANHYIAWDSSWYRGFFNNSAFGDTSIASIHAHEWGHATQSLWRLSGWRLRYSLYRELYADCMTGSWAADMYLNRRLDNIGVGDYREALNIMYRLGSANVPARTHGTPAERQSFFRYGWTYGAQACINWVYR